MGRLHKGINKKGSNNETKEQSDPVAEQIAKLSQETSKQALPEEPVTSGEFDDTEHETGVANSAGESNSDSDSGINNHDGNLGGEDGVDSNSGGSSTNSGDADSSSDDSSADDSGSDGDSAQNSEVGSQPSIGANATNDETSAETSAETSENQVEFDDWWKEMLYMAHQKGENLANQDSYRHQFDVGLSAKEAFKQNYPYHL